MGKRGGDGAKGAGLKKGPWTKAEDAILVEYVQKHGEGNWNAVQKNCGLSRCGKSCRLRWANHLRPNLKKGSFSPDEELLILRLHAQLGNKWARMAAQLPGRTDNEIKNYWNTRIKKRLKAGLPLYPPEIQSGEGPSPAAAAAPLHSALSADVTSARFALPHPIDFSASITPLLPHDSLLLSPAPHLKSVSLPYSAPVSPSSTAVLFPYGMRSYDLGSMLGNPLLSHTSPSSVKTELPSTQLFPEPLGSGGDVGGGQSGNSGLLDALLLESQSLRASLREKAPPPLPTDDRGVKIELLEVDGSKAGGPPPQDQNPVLEPGNKWEEPNGSAGIKPKMESMEEMVDPAHEDISTLLDMIPTVPMSMSALVPEWYNSGGGDISNGQSSGVTDSDLGLDLRHLTSSLSVKPEDHDWTMGSCLWNNMPGIC